MKTRMGKGLLRDRSSVRLSRGVHVNVASALTHPSVVKNGKSFHSNSNHVSALPSRFGAWPPSAGDLSLVPCTVAIDARWVSFGLIGDGFSATTRAAVPPVLQK